MLLVCAAGCSTAANGPSPSTTETATATVAASGDFKAQASAVVDEIAAGRYADAEAKFDVTMKARLPAAQLLDAWRTYQQTNGTYKSHGTPTEVLRGDIHVERVPITTSTGTGEVRISYHPDGTIAGLFFLNANPPAP